MARASLPIALALSLLLVPLVPLTTALPPPPLDERPILAITLPGDAVVPALLAAGFPACGAAPSADCFDAVDPNAFAAADLAQRRVLFVGTHDAFGPVEAALDARAADIDAFLAAGGSLVTLAEPTPPNPNGWYAGGYEYIPNSNSYPFYTQAVVGDAVTITSYGSTHPALPASTSASLSGWGLSFVSAIGERAPYLYPLARGSGTITVSDPDNGEQTYASSGDVVLAGNYGDGCVVLATLRADEVAAGGGARASDAQTFLRDVVGWGLDCGVAPLFPFPYAGAIRIGVVNGGPITVQTAPTLDCSGPMYQGGGVEVTCVPTVAPPPGATWACFGQTVAAWHVGVSEIYGESSCAGTIAASCTADATPTCLATSALSTGPLPIRCYAKPGPKLVQTGVNWQVGCGSLDP